MPRFKAPQIASQQPAMTYDLLNRPTSSYYEPRYKSRHMHRYTHACNIHRTSQLAGKGRAQQDVRTVTLVEYTVKSV